VSEQRAGPGGLRNHRLTHTELEALCEGRGDGSVVRELWRAQRSRRLLLLGMIVEAGEAVPDLLSPLAPASDAWRMLADAEDSAPEAITRLLLHPQVGSWAAYVLRRHRKVAAGGAPMWVDFGVIHTIALVAAAVAGLKWRTLVPARDGQIMFPALGMASVPAQTRWAVMEVETADGYIRLLHPVGELTVPPPWEEDFVSGSASWRGLRRFTVGGGADPCLSVTLDDLDPFRDLADPIEPQRLSLAEADQWSTLLGEAWRLLCRRHTETAQAMAPAVTCLVPLPDDGLETRSASTGEAFGSVMVSLPSNAVTLAVSLVHEFQHTKLGGLMHLIRLTEGDDEQLHYAPWRDDPRPLSGLLQGTYAFVGIAAFWRELRRSPSERGSGTDVTDFEYAYSRTQVDDALRTIAASAGLTRWGQMIGEHLADRVRPWLAEPVAPEAERLAMLLSEGHRAGWRIRYLRPRAEAVQGLADAWRAGALRADPVEVDAAMSAAFIAPQSRETWSRGLNALVRRRVHGPVGSLSVRLQALGLTEMDVALVEGEKMCAADGYRSRITANHGDLSAWVGLGLADPSCGALLRLPALARAVYASLARTGRAPDPVSLAVWLAPEESGK
jgi:HEXXH motif-containing protein